MQNVVISKQATIRLTADQWDLYTNAQTRECAVAADAINLAIEDAFNAGQSRTQVESIALEVMHRYADQGAYDSEPLYMLSRLLDELFGGLCCKKRFTELNPTDVTCRGLSFSIREFPR
jgi:hypothetical protein